MLGQRLARALEREGVNIELALRFDAPTTLGLGQARRRGVPQYAFYGNGAGRPASRRGRLPALPAEIGAIHLGSSPPWSNRSPRHSRRWCANAKGAWRPDPNVPQRGPSLERWRSKVDTLAGLAHLVKISDEDAELLYGDASDDALAASWLDKGTSLVVMTRRQRAQAPGTATAGSISPHPWSR